jgi:hypothetical protein
MRVDSLNPNSACWRVRPGATSARLAVDVSVIKPSPFYFSLIGSRFSVRAS